MAEAEELLQKSIGQNVASTCFFAQYELLFCIEKEAFGQELEDKIQSCTEK